MTAESPASPIPLPEASRAPARGPLDLDIAALTHRGCVRPSNEDAYLVFRIGRYLEAAISSVPESELPPRAEDVGHLMIVADGVGGHQAGEVASRTALTTALQLIEKSNRWALRFDDPTTREREIREMAARAQSYLSGVQDEIRKRVELDPSLAGMATTFTGAYWVGTELFVLHLGDSRAYLHRAGAIRKITNDHTVAQEYADLGLIPQQDVPDHHLHHVLTRALGGPDPSPKGDFHHLVVAPGDRLLICSDGLTEMASETEIAETLGRHPTSAEACRALVELAIARGGRDNVTAIVASRPRS